MRVEDSIPRTCVILQICGPSNIFNAKGGFFGKFPPREESARSYVKGIKTRRMVRTQIYVLIRLFCRALFLQLCASPAISFFEIPTGIRASTLTPNLTVRSFTAEGWPSIIGIVGGTPVIPWVRATKTLTFDRGDLILVL